jgi:hypothetical protein
LIREHYLHHHSDSINVQRIRKQDLADEESMNNYSIENSLDNEIATAGAQLSSLHSKDTSPNANSGRNGAANSSQEHHSHVDNNISMNHMMPRRESIGVVNVLGDALFGRRSSFGLGGDMVGDMTGLGGGSMMARRGSMDSVVDAAIQNLANRRLSMLGGSTHAAMNANAMNNTIGTHGGMGFPPLGMSPSTMGGGLGMMGLQSRGMHGINGPAGMNIHPNGTISMSSQMNQFLMNGLGLNSMAGSSNHPVANINTDGNSSQNGFTASNTTVDSDQGGTANMRQKQLQDQRTELQRRQKELEFQRQQLLSAMEQRKQAMQQMQETIQQGERQQYQQQHQETDRRHSLFGGALGGGEMGSNYFVCRLNSKAFSNSEDALACENACRAKLESKWRQNSGMRDERHGSLDLLGALAGVTQEAEVTNNLRNKNINSNPEISQIRSNGGIISDQSNGSSSGHLVNAQSIGSFSVIKKPIPLGLRGDKDWLTPLHCFVRLHCVEVFTATKVDVAIPTKGKRKPIQIGQVGIRCPHCHISETGLVSRERGSVYYPTRYVMSLVSTKSNCCHLRPPHLIPYNCDPHNQFSC